MAACWTISWVMRKTRWRALQSPSAPHTRLVSALGQRCLCVRTACRIYSARLSQPLCRRSSSSRTLTRRSCKRVSRGHPVPHLPSLVAYPSPITAATVPTAALLSCEFAHTVALAPCAVMILLMSCVATLSCDAVRTTTIRWWCWLGIARANACKMHQAAVLRE